MQRSSFTHLEKTFDSGPRGLSPTDPYREFLKANLGVVLLGRKRTVQSFFLFLFLALFGKKRGEGGAETWLTGGN